ncbi:MAG: GtrA family protein [Clostridia bacterium]|nr:GtrA family protein [Clostridia bacterium]
MKDSLDIFDKIMSLPGIRVLFPFYKKHKQVLLYLFFGAVTTVVSIGVFSLLNVVLGVNEHIANLTSWVLAVLVAFLTNRTMVFEAETASAGEFFAQMIKFYAGRVATLLVEELIIFVFITTLKFDSFTVKLSAQIVILILNYVISKLFVFKNNGAKEK